MRNAQLAPVFLGAVIALAVWSWPPPATAGPEAYDMELTNYTYPYPVSFHGFTSQKQELRMAYADVKPERPNGRAVVLLHGKNFSAAYWEPTVRKLTAGGYRVIAPDQIGFGKSTKPANYQFSFHQLAANTKSLLASLGVTRAAVIGHSMGGMLATRFALMYPEATEKLVLVGPLGLEDYRDGVPYRDIDESYAQELKATPDSIRAYMRKTYFAGEWKPEYESLVEIQAGWTRHAGHPRVAWDSALTLDMIFTQPVVHEFPLVRVPTLLLIGLRDKSAPGSAWAPKAVAERMGNFAELGKRAAKAIPNAQLVEFPAAGHLPQVQDFDGYIRALTAFLDGP